MRQAFSGSCRRCCQSCGSCRDAGTARSKAKKTTQAAAFTMGAGDPGGGFVIDDRRAFMASRRRPHRDARWGAAWARRPALPAIPVPPISPPRAAGRQQHRGLVLPFSKRFLAAVAFGCFFPGQAFRADSGHGILRISKLRRFKYYVSQSLVPNAGKHQGKKNAGRPKGADPIEKIKAIINDRRTPLQVQLKAALALLDHENGKLCNGEGPAARA